VSKNFTQTGIGQSVEFSDGGARVKDNTGAIEIRDNSDASYAVCRGADPVTDDDLATRRYVISTAGEVNTASNLAATGIFSAKVGDDLQFKGITSTGGTVSITNTATTVNLEASGEANTASNLGGGEGVFASKVGVDLQFKSLTSTGSVSLSSTATEVTIDSSGEANTASNIGAGEGLFSAKVGDDLEFKSLTSTGGTVVITSTATSVNLESSGESNTASNLAATGVFASKVGADLQFKGITSTGGTLAITNTATTVNIEVSPYAQVLFSRRGNTGNNTFFDVDDFPTRIPSLTQGAAGWPISPTSAVTVNRLLFRTRRAAGANATFEVLRCQGNGLTGTAVSLGTVVIPGGVFEFDAAPAWGIPAGSWTLVARRTTGSGGTANAWLDPTVILEVS